MHSFLQVIHERVLILDGAMGTLLQERGLPPGGCPEAMNLQAPAVVAGIHREYAEAGADILVTNTFGANRCKLSHYGLEGEVAAINARAVEITRGVALPGNFVAASIGPTGRFLEPVGDAGFDEMVEIYAEQIRAVAGAGADLISFETFLDIRELRAGIIACHEVCSLPVIAQMTFDDNGRSVLGTSPEAAAVTLDGLRVDVIGSNCGLGVEGIYDILQRMRTVTPRPLISQANAGLPTLCNGVTIFPGTPEEMVAYHERMIALGVRVIGGCCGTTPAHIRAMRAALSGNEERWTPPPRRLFLSSRSGVVEIGQNAPCALIGERINPTGKKGYSQELREGKTAYIRREAQEQCAAGATLLDINCGTPGIDEAAALERAVFAVSSVTSAPLVLDSSDPQALERGLKAADGKVLINSVSGEGKSQNSILPLAYKYGAAIIALALDGAGIPESAEERVVVAQAIVTAATKAGLQREDIIIDCLTLTVSAEQQRAVETLRTLRLVRNQLRLPTVLGVSNISFGLPARPVLSSTFFAMALEAGLCAAIVNPKEERMLDAWRGAMVLLGKDLRAGGYIAAYANLPATPLLPSGSGEEPLRARLGQAIINGDREGIVPLVEEALAAGLLPLEISNEGLLPGLEEVGKRFGDHRMFLPQVMLSSETMQAAFTRLKKELHGIGASQGKILMATVEGDIHDIGKNIVCTLLENHGFEVIDLGKNVPAAKILARARAEKVDAVGLSALMTTTLAQMESTISLLQQEGVKVLTMVGGAVVTPEYAASIGADLYAVDALQAVAKIKELFRQKAE